MSLDKKTNYWIEFDNYKEKLNQMSRCVTNSTVRVLRPAKTSAQSSIVLLWFSVVLFWCQSFGDVSP